jgi:diguanylate cyclase (GGDEF)-like protein
MRRTDRGGVMRVLWRPFLGGVVILAASTAFVDQDIGDTVAVFAAVLSSAATALGIGHYRLRRRIRGQRGQPVDRWTLYALGASVLVVAYALHLNDPERAFPGLPEYLALGAHIPLAAATTGLIADRIPGRALATLLSAMLASASASYVAGIAVLHTAPNDPTSAAVVMGVALPAATLLLVILGAYLLRLSEGSRAMVALLLGAALSLLLLLVFDTLGSLYGYSFGPPAPALVILGFGFYGAAALHPATGVLVEPALATNTRIGGWHVAGLLAPVIAGPVGTWVEVARDSRLAAPALVGSSSLSLLVVLYLVQLVQSRSGLAHRVHHDDLTGLPNRALFEDRLEVALGQAERRGGRIAVLFLDLDHFKTVNDSLGHAVGNHLLQGVGKRLRTVLRAEDTVARLGGDEFGVLLADIMSPEDASHVAEKLLEAFGSAVTTGRRSLFISASIGVAVHPDHGDTPESLVKHADLAMYRAKEAGRNGYRVYTPAMGAQADERFQLEHHLRHALDGGQLVLHYQPVVDLETERIVGAEALLRWQHPEHGLLRADRFVGVAEESGLIAPIGQWVLEQACQDAARWQELDLPPVVVAVNLSAREFDDRSVADVTADVLRRTGLRPTGLEFELTESLALGDTLAIARVLEDLREMGVRCTIDDFGTGYSGLSYLSHLPIDRLKIDRSFVRTIGGGETPMVGAVIALAHSLGKQVVAEGVETADQIAFLRQLSCDEVQGNVICPPIAAEEFEALLAREALPAVPGRLATLLRSHGDPGTNAASGRVS